MLTLSETAAPRPLLNGAFEELNPEVSPDGRWLAYQSSESGRLMIKRAAAAVENTNRPHMVLVQHWTEELKRLVPAK